MRFQRHILFPFERTLIILLMVAMLLSAGAWSIYHNRIQLLPDVDPPKISFRVNWPGASERLLLTQVIRPYEQALRNKLPSLQQLQVKMAQERILFEATFEYGTRLETAEQNIRTLLARTRPLPLNVDPIEFRYGGSNVSNRVVGSYFFTSDSGEFNDAQKQAIEVIALQEIELLKGIDLVELNPRLERQLTIELNAHDLVKFNLTFDQVRNVVSQILDAPVGTIRTGGKIIRSEYRGTEHLTILANTPISYQGGVMVSLGDISDIRIEQVPLTAVARFNGENAIAMRVLRKHQENLIELQEQVSTILQQHSQTLDSLGLRYHLSFDTALFIKRALSWVLGSILLGFLLSLVLSYVFFRRLAPTFLAALITLLSISGVMAVLDLLNVSINVISLAGLTFAVGMFVDGVLILYEQLDQQANGKFSSIFEIRGKTGQVVPALTASTLTSVVVFLPIIFNQGAEGQLFAGLAVAYASGLLISLLLTVLITPWFVFHFIQPQVKPSVITPTLFSFTNRLIATRVKRLGILTLLIPGCLALALWLMPNMSFLPTIKRDAIDIFVPLGRDKTLDTLDKELIHPISEQFQQDQQLPAIKNAYALGWENFFTAAIRLENNDELESALAHLKQTLPEQYPNHRVIVMQGNLFGGLEERNNVELMLFVSDQQWLADNLENIKTVITQEIPGVSLRFDPNLGRQATMLEVTPRFDRIRSNGITEQDLKSVFRLLSGADFVGVWTDNGDPLNTFLVTARDSSIAEYEQIPYLTPTGNQTYLGELLTFKQRKVAPPLIRIDGSAVLVAKLRLSDPGITVSDVEAKLQSTVLPKLQELISHRGRVEVRGSAASLQKAKGFVLWMTVFVMAALFAIVALIFRSARVGSYVLLSLVPAFLGGVLGFRLLNLLSPSSFNVLTLIGFMIMLGIVINNAILLIESMRRHFLSGAPLSDAVALGVNSRTRAILVSTLTSVFGMLPLLIFPSEASLLYRGIAAVIVGGMIANLMSVFLLTGTLVSQFGFGHPAKTNLLQKIKQKLPQGAAA